MNVTGKGGVGKTSISCATAIALADRGRRVLLVSTDPASNLDEVLGVKLGSMPTAVPGVAQLEAMNLDPELAASEYRELAASEYREKMVGPYRGDLPEATVRSMEEQLSGSCTMEIAAFDEFSRLLCDPGRTAAYDHVIFDTAPTGHTLRLLSLPHAWSSFIETSTTGTSCLGPLAGLKDQQQLYAASVEALANPERMPRQEIRLNLRALLGATALRTLFNDGAPPEGERAVLHWGGRRQALPACRAGSVAERTSRRLQGVTRNSGRDAGRKRLGVLVSPRSQAPPRRAERSGSIRARCVVPDRVADASHRRGCPFQPRRKRGARVSRGLGPRRRTHGKD